MKTIAVDLWSGQVRDGHNARTLMHPAPRGTAVSPYSLRDLFVRSYSRFADSCRTVEEPGVAVLAVHERTGHAAGMVKLLARPGRPVAAIVGRHDRCDLLLRSSDELALRQLAIVLDPVTSWQRGESHVCYRMFDLRTQGGMRDEHGRPLRGMRAEGPTIVRCAGYTLFMCALGDPSDWPANGELAWERLPERVYFDELAQTPEASSQLHRSAVRGATGASSRHSMVMRTVGPRAEAGATGVQASEDIAGTLELEREMSDRRPWRSSTLAISCAALRDGVLLGRYGRCDAASAIDDDSVSRVHLLLVRDGERMIAIDTASSIGTRVLGGDGARQRLVVLEPGCDLQLGHHTIARWRWLA